MLCGAIKPRQRKQAFSGCRNAPQQGSLKSLQNPK